MLAPGSLPFSISSDLLNLQVRFQANIPSYTSPGASTGTVGGNLKRAVKTHVDSLIILDIDETLIHASKEPKSENWDFEVSEYKVIIRPHLQSFLSYLNQNFSIAIWSSASDYFVREVVKQIIPAEIDLLFVWSRNKCTYKPNHEIADAEGYFDYYSHYDYIKILKKVTHKFQFQKEKILIIDDTPRKSMKNYGNAITPIEFRGDKNDNELLLLMKYLDSIKDQPNYRNIEKRNWRQEIK